MSHQFFSGGSVFSLASCLPAGRLGIALPLSVANPLGNHSSNQSPARRTWVQHLYTGSVLIFLPFDWIGPAAATAYPPSHRPSRGQPLKPGAALRRTSHLAKKLVTLLDLCVSSLRRGHANLLCIVPILTDDLRRGSTWHVMSEVRQRSATLHIANAGIQAAWMVTGGARPHVSELAWWLSAGVVGHRRGTSVHTFSAFWL